MLTGAAWLLAAVVLVLVWTTVSHMVLKAAEGTAERLAMLEDTVYGQMLGWETTAAGDARDGAPGGAQP